MTKRPSAVFLISVLSSTAFAASAEDDIVVSATRSPAPLSEVGSSVAVITADDFRARQYSFVIDALRDAAGVSVVRNGCAGGAELQHLCRRCPRREFKRCYTGWR